MHMNDHRTLRKMEVVLHRFLKCGRFRSCFFGICLIGLRLLVYMVDASYEFLRIVDHFHRLAFRMFELWTS